MSTAIAGPARASNVPANSALAAGLISLSGLSLILAGALIAFFPILHPNHDAVGYASPIWVPVHWMPAIGMILAQFGLIGLLARQLERGGRLSVIGFAAAFLGNALLLTGTDVEAFVLPFLGLNQPLLMQGPPPTGQHMAWIISGLVFTIGYALLGAVVIRAGVLPWAAGRCWLAAASSSASPLRRLACCHRCCCSARSYSGWRWRGSAIRFGPSRVGNFKYPRAN